MKQKNIWEEEQVEDKTGKEINGTTTRNYYDTTHRLRDIMILHIGSATGRAWKLQGFCLASNTPTFLQVVVNDASQS